jgi:arylsulfatase A-like enzyme
LPPNADYEMQGKAPHLRQAAEHWRRGAWQLFEPKTFEAGRLRKLHGYLGSVSHVDHAVGELLDWLDETGLSGDTIVVYSSDHGDYACEHGIMEKAPGICADAITRIPMLWRCPGRFKAGHAAHEIVEAVDLANTLCALAGLEAMETADGRDISHLLRGGSGEVRAIGVTEFAWSKSVRMGPYRLVYYPREMFAAQYPDGFGELYDLDADPWEMHNLYFKADYADLVQRIRAELLDWLVTTTRPATIHPAVSETSAQSELHYHHAVNPDGKTHPDRIRSSRTTNYL